MKIKKRYHLKKKAIKQIKNDLGDYSSLIDTKSSVEMLEAEPTPFVLVDGEPFIIILNDKPYPTLKAALNSDLTMKTAVVDMGAVKFVTNGADIMSPGIVDADNDIEAEDVVLIVEERHHKPLAIGISLISGEEMVSSNKGKAVKTLHFVGDEIWNMEI